MSRQDFVRGQLSNLSAPQALGALNNRWALAAPGDFASDVDVLNYALTLEYLEAAFYQQGNKAGLLDGIEAQYLASIQADEEYHVQALTDTINKLGGTPVAAPGVDFGGAFADRNSYLTTSVDLRECRCRSVSRRRRVHPGQVDPAGCCRHLRCRGPARRGRRQSAGSACRGWGLQGCVRDADLQDRCAHRGHPVPCPNGRRNACRCTEHGRRQYRNQHRRPRQHRPDRRRRGSTARCSGLRRAQDHHPGSSEDSQA